MGLGSDAEDGLREAELLARGLVSGKDGIEELEFLPKGKDAFGEDWSLAEREGGFCEPQLHAKGEDGFYVPELRAHLRGGSFVPCRVRCIWRGGGSLGRPPLPHAQKQRR